MSCFFHSERWLLRQCEDPVFFSNMHTHTDICFLVENNARVGAFMLALRQMTQSFQIHQAILQLDPRPFTWTCMVVLACTLLFCPSLILSNARTVRRWDLFFWDDIGDWNEWRLFLIQELAWKSLLSINWPGFLRLYTVFKGDVKRQQSSFFVSVFQNGGQKCWWSLFTSPNK